MICVGFKPTDLSVTRCAIRVCLLCIVSGLLAIECAEQRTQFVNNVTTAQSDRNNRSSTVNESNSSRMSARVLLILKLLHLLHNYSSQNETIPVNSASESRSMTSWLRLRRPVQRQESQYLMDRNAMPNQDFPGHGSSRPLLPPMMSANYNHFDKPQDPNSFFLMPSLTDTTGIDYWLKFIENANIDDRTMPTFQKDMDKGLPTLKPIPMLKRTKNNRSKSKSRPSERKATKIRQEISKPSNPNEDYDTDISGNNDIALDSKSTGSSKVSKQIEYDTSPRCDKFTDEICIDDFEYPEHAILEEIFKRKEIFQLMYSEVKGDAPLVDGIPRDEEENFSQDYYYNNNDNSENEDYDGYPLVNRTQLYNDFVEEQEQAKLAQEKNDRGGFVCRSEVLYAKPKLARNIKGKWRVIVNAGDFTQTVRMEKCTKPNSECRFIADHKYDSRCAQISAIHRLLVFEKGKGFYIDTFRIPTACTCHVHSNKADQAKYGTSFSTEGSSASANVKRDKAKSNLGDTLWSLLGTEPDKNKGSSTNSNRKGQVLNGILSEQSKNGLNQIELLKLLPQLTSIAPENVLQQLLEDYTDTSSQQQGYGHRVNNPLNDITSKVPAGELQHILAHMQHNEVPKENQKRPTDKAGSFQHPTTTTIVSPGGNQGAPVVQVIHVPVSSEIVTTDVESVPFEDNRFTPRNRLRTVYSSGAITRNTPKHPKYLISTSSNYMHSQSKTNSSVAPPPIPNVTQSMVTKHSDQSSKGIGKMESTASGEGQAKDMKQILDKKINFSYHPILEYIVH